MGLTEKEAKLFSVAGLLHDVGKITVSLEILKKTDKLEPQEWKINEKHTREGARLLGGSNSKYLHMGTVVALSHHERWDGSGYPNGTRGDDIPLLGRICAVADVYDALTTKREYKREISDEEAFKLIGESSGSLFDPAIIRVFTDNFIKLVAIKKNAMEMAG